MQDQIYRKYLTQPEIFSYHQVIVVFANEAATKNTPTNMITKLINKIPFLITSTSFKS